jgi:hypothetical protein
VREFKASLWQWIEEINEKAPDAINPLNGIIDEN